MKGYIASGTYLQLANNIDASSTLAWNSGAGFAPVGTFSGTFDGDDHTISGLTINRPAEGNIGLFGSTSDATITNVGLVGGSVSGSSTIGGLIGSSSGGSVSHSYATMPVSGQGGFVGGLIGYDNGTPVSYSYATGNISGSESVGGLIGENTGVISNSFATGNVNAQGRYTGGLIGFTWAAVSDSYSTGNVSSVDGYGIGGMLGRAAGAAITNSFSTGRVNIGSSYLVGGFLGYGGWGSSVSNCYWNIQTSGQGTSAGGTGLTTSQMMNSSNFSGWDLTNTWRIYDGLTNPLLKSF